MEERAEEKDHFAAGVTLSIIGLTAAAIAVPCGIAVLTLILDGPVKEISMAACLGQWRWSYSLQGRSAARSINTAQCSVRTTKDGFLQWMSGNMSAVAEA